MHDHTEKAAPGPCCPCGALLEEDGLHRCRKCRDRSRWQRHRRPRRNRHAGSRYAGSRRPPSRRGR